MAIGLYRRFRQQTYIVVCGGVTFVLLLARYLAFDKSDSGRGGGVIIPSDGGGGPPRRGYGTYATSRGGSDPGDAPAPLPLDRFVEGGTPLTSEEMAQRNAEWKVDQALKVSVDGGSVTVRRSGGGDSPAAEAVEGEIPYLHCGPMYGLGVDGPGGPGGGGGGGGGLRGGPSRGGGSRELLLLRGARFSKDDWRASGVLDGLCLLGASAGSGGGAGGLSVTAIDLPADADGIDLADAFRALRSAGILSGDPAFVATPSASGAAVVGLAELAAAAGGLLLRRIVRGWIPVSAGAVLAASPGAVRAFPEAGVPVLAVHGSDGGGGGEGRRSAARLVEEAGARRVELEGGHACYLDSPDEFVKAVLGFVDDVCRDQDAAAARSQ